MRPANERRRYIVTLIGWVHTQNDTCYMTCSGRKSNYGLNGHTPYVTFTCELWSTFNSLWLVMPYVNIDLGQRWLMCLSGTKPSPEPMLTNHHWGLVAFTSGQFHRKCSTQDIHPSYDFENYQSKFTATSSMIYTSVIKHQCNEYIPYNDHIHYKWSWFEVQHIHNILIVWLSNFCIFLNRLHTIWKKLYQNYLHNLQFYLSWVIGQWDMLSPGARFKIKMSYKHRY